MAPALSDSESSRRPYGTGTLYLYRGRWRAQFPLANGQRIKKSFGTETAALDWLDEQVVKRYGGNSPQAEATVRDTSPTPEMTLIEYAERLIEKRYSEGKISDGTLANYRSSLTNYWGDLGPLTLKSVDSENLRQFIQNLNTLRPNGTALSYPSQHAQWRFVTTVFNAASKAGLIDSRVLTSVEFPSKQAWQRTLTQRRNPAPVKPRRRTGEQARFIPEAQYKRLSAALAKSERAICSLEAHALGWCGAEGYLAIVTALRQGERLAVKREGFVPEYSSSGEISSATLTIKEHAVPSTWFHGCGDASTDGSYPCGEKESKKCSNPQSDKQGRTAMKLVPGTKSNDENSTHILKLPAVPAMLLLSHLRFMSEVEGLDKPEHLMFGGVVAPRMPVRWKRDTDESWAKRLEEWRKACTKVKRDGVTIRTSDRDRAAWDAIQAEYFFEGEATGFDVHSIRHSTLAMLAMHTTLNVIQIMELANHASVETTLGYIKRYRPEGASAAMEASAQFSADYAASIGESTAEAALLRSQMIFG